MLDCDSRAENLSPKQAAQKWLAYVEQNGEFLQLRLAAREGLYALQGKPFSYEREVFQAHTYTCKERCSKHTHTIAPFT